MTTTSFDFSRRPELGLHAAAIAAVQDAAAPAGAVPLIVGAFARDLHLLYAHGIDTRRETTDLDIALALPDWAAFTRLRERLIAHGDFKGSSTVAHRLRHRNGLPIDLVPFGRVETADRKIAWPPRGDEIMDVFGFREALEAAVQVSMPGEVRASVVSLPALAMLKLVCWQDRHYTSPRKDAFDLQLIVTNYLSAGNEARLWSEFVEWTQEEDFEYELVGPRMLGHDIRPLLDAKGMERMSKALSEQTDSARPARLANQMNPDDPERARALLEALLVGLIETSGER
ncbi:MAG: nucleotidyl transferase AbiEii/AbiGii toxin family protein [Burkholderiaceae bacterium]